MSNPPMDKISVIEFAEKFSKLFNGKALYAAAVTFAWASIVPSLFVWVVIVAGVYGTYKTGIKYEGTALIFNRFIGISKLMEFSSNTLTPTPAPNTMSWSNWFPFARNSKRPFSKLKFIEDSTSAKKLNLKILVLRFKKRSAPKRVLKPNPFFPRLLLISSKLIIISSWKKSEILK